jgi:hypothetical protein
MAQNRFIQSHSPFGLPSVRFSCLSQAQAPRNPGQGTLGAQVQISSNMAGLEIVCEPNSPKKQRNTQLRNPPNLEMPPDWMAVRGTSRECPMSDGERRMGIHPASKHLSLTADSRGSRSGVPGESLDSKKQSEIRWKTRYAPETC